jgi:2-succinyl-6-hydroxy-2,4-cyclohexadiene-1-carboxylate synthase
LLGASPGIRDDAERVSRRASDEQLAQDIMNDGVAAFLDRWLAGPLFAGLPHDAAQREDRLRNSASGLAGSLRTCGTGVQDNLWPRLQELKMPVLVMAGARDTKFAAIAKELTAEIGPTASLRLVPAAGHTAHLEQPDEFVRLLIDWLHVTV